MRCSGHIRPASYASSSSGDHAGKTASLGTSGNFRKRRQANETAAEFEEKTLDGLFLESADKFPDKEALVTCSRRMTYREIKEEAFYISGQLQSDGIKRRDGSCIYGKVEQVVAVYGIMFAGAALSSDRYP